MMVLFWEVVETLEGGTWLEEVGHWRQVLGDTAPLAASCLALCFLACMM